MKIHLGTRLEGPSPMSLVKKSLPLPNKNRTAMSINDPTSELFLFVIFFIWSNHTYLQKISHKKIVCPNTGQY